MFEKYARISRPWPSAAERGRRRPNKQQPESEHTARLCVRARVSVCVGEYTSVCSVRERVGAPLGRGHKSRVKWKRNFAARLRSAVENSEHGKVQVSRQAAEDGHQETDQGARPARGSAERSGNRRREHLLRTFPVQRNIR